MNSIDLKEQTLEELYKYHFQVSAEREKLLLQLQQSEKALAALKGEVQSRLNTEIKPKEKGPKK